MKKDKWNPFRKLFRKGSATSTEPVLCPDPEEAARAAEVERYVVVVKPVHEDGSPAENGDSDGDVIERLVLEVDPIRDEVQAEADPEVAQTPYVEPQAVVEEVVDEEEQEKLIFVIEPTPKEYAIFGLDDSATDRELKQSYRDLIKIHHPDNGGDTRRFIKIQKAYEKIMEYRKIGL